MSTQMAKSSDKIITHMLKRYLERKEHAQMKRFDHLPKIENSFTGTGEEEQGGNWGKNIKATHNRVATDCE